MDDDTFLARMADWEALPGDVEDESYYRNGEAISPPLDTKFDNLCTLYLEANHKQRLLLVKLFAAYKGTAPPERAAYARFDNLILGYMWRISRRIIASPGEAFLLRLGLAAAAIAQEHPDARDIIVALAFLHYAARQAHIDPRPHFEAVAALARLETRKFILDFLKRGNKEIDEIADYFGGTG